MYPSVVASNLLSDIFLTYSRLYCQTLLGPLFQHLCGYLPSANLAEGPHTGNVEIFHSGTFSPGRLATAETCNEGVLDGTFRLRRKTVFTFRQSRRPQLICSHWCGSPPDATPPHSDRMGPPPYLQEWDRRSLNRIKLSHARKIWWRRSGDSFPPPRFTEI